MYMYTHTHTHTHTHWFCRKKERGIEDKTTQKYWFSCMPELHWQFGAGGIFLMAAKGSQTTIPSKHLAFRLTLSVRDTVIGLWCLLLRCSFLVSVPLTRKIKNNTHIFIPLHDLIGQWHRTSILQNWSQEADSKLVGVYDTRWYLTSEQLGFLLSSPVVRQGLCPLCFYNTFRVSGCCLLRLGRQQGPHLL
jgi:hypothetical protein